AEYGAASGLIAPACRTQRLLDARTLRQLDFDLLEAPRPGADKGHLHSAPRSATLMKSSTIRSARLWKPMAIAGPSSFTAGSNVSVSVTLQADSSSAWNSQRPDRRRNGPSTSRRSMWCEIGRAACRERWT